MDRRTALTAALVPVLSGMIAGSASRASAAPARVALTDAPPVMVEPGALVARYQQVRDQVAGLVHDALEPDWLVDVAGAIGSRFSDATAGSRTWLVRLVAPLAPTPPDLTCLTAYPVPEHTTSGYGWRDDPIRHHTQFHAGADIHATRGTPVHSAGDGEVVFAGRQHGYGNLVMVDHGHGVVTRYAHLSKILVAKGDVVMAAQEIGKVGATGRATGPHLHFEVRIDGRPVAPQLAMQVAELERTSPDLARLAGLALSPDVQAHWINEQDPPRGVRKHDSEPPAGTRPERRGRAPRPHLNS